MQPIWALVRAVVSRVSTPPFNCPVREARPRFHVEKQRGIELAEAFFAASRSGDMRVPGAMLAEDVSRHSDGGGKRTATGKPVFGFERVMKMHAYLAGLFATHASTLVRAGFINGLPGSSR